MRVVVAKRRDFLCARSAVVGLGVLDAEAPTNLVVPFRWEINVKQDEALFAAGSGELHPREKPEVEWRVKLLTSCDVMLHVRHHDHFMVISESNRIQAAADARINKIRCPLCARFIDLFYSRWLTGLRRSLSETNRSIAKPVGVSRCVNLEIALSPDSKGIHSTDTRCGMSIERSVCG